MFHIAAHIEHHGDGAQAAHDTTDAEGIGNGLAQTIALGDVEVDDGGGFVATDLEHGDGIIGTVKGFFAIGGGDNSWFGAQCFSHFVGDDF